MNISKSLTKLFYRGFYIACLILFVAFPVQSFIPYYGTNDKFWRPFCLFFVFTAFVLLIALLVQHLADRGKKWISALAAIVLFSFTLFSHLPIVLEYGAQTTQVSDFGNALATSQVQPPIKSIHYSVFSNWTLFPKTLAIVQQLFGTGELSVLVVNTVLYAFSVVLIYCLVQLSNVKHNEFLGFVAAAFYAAWPSSYLWCLITAPDYWHICTLLLALLILGIAIRFTKRWWSKSGLITISALLVVLSDFYKTTSTIMIVAIAIWLVLYAIKWIQEQRAARKKLFRWSIFNALFRRFGAYALLFLLVFSLGKNACFRYQDYYVGWTVNRNSTPHFLWMGLYSGSQGSYVPEYASRFSDLVVENDMNYDIASERILEELKEDIAKNKHLSPSMFFVKARTAFEAENYMYFITATLHPDDQAVEADAITRWTSYINFYYVMMGILLTWAIYKLRDQDLPLWFIASLYITGFVFTMLLLENQARYKIVIYPYMCILAAYPFALLPEKILCRNKQYQSIEIEK